MIGGEVEVSNINKYFGSFKVLNNVNLTIQKGEFFSLLGPSGCGKTTLLRIIAGFEFPSEGNLLLDGKNILPVPANMRSVN
ncbi:MAG TPA: ATP-binding cassette domain-containing protein, partial [Spirochaetota bacterium]|nr:ATP-binding cassette domain-containing protein [Spirochaetota bacterium]